MKFSFMEVKTLLSKENMMLTVKTGATTRHLGLWLTLAMDNVSVFFVSIAVETLLY